jgi:hypothetical protein
MSVSKTFSFFLMPCPSISSIFPVITTGWHRKKFKKIKIQIRYLHLVKPLAIGFTGIGPMLSFAWLNSSKSVASGFTLHKTRGVSHFGLVIYILKVSQGKRRIMETQIFHHAKI